MKVKCPLCEGEGKVEKNVLRNRAWIKERKLKAIKMRKLGFTYTEIMKALGYKSPRSVAIQLK
jgi:hypothetical protein